MYINQNVSLKTGGRKAPAGGSQYLQPFLNEDKLYDAIGGNLKGVDFTDFLNDVEKVEFDFENIMGPKMHTTSSGVDFISFEAAGDWEVPLIVILYWDGYNYRGYVPMKGNTVNLLTKSAFGNNEDEDEGYCAAYGTTDADYFDIDEASCFEDFEKRITVI